MSAKSEIDSEAQVKGMGLSDGDYVFFYYPSAAANIIATRIHISLNATLQFLKKMLVDQLDLECSAGEIKISLSKRLLDSDASSDVELLSNTNISRGGSWDLFSQHARSNATATLLSLGIKKGTIVYVYYPPHARKVESPKNSARTTENACFVCGDPFNHRGAGTDTSSNFMCGVDSIKKDLEKRRVIAIDLSVDLTTLKALPRLEICEKSTVRQLKTAVATFLRRKIPKAEVTADGLSLARPQPKRSRFGSTAAKEARLANWHQYNSTKILDPRVHDGHRCVFLDRQSKKTRRIVALHASFSDNRALKLSKTDGNFDASGTKSDEAKVDDDGDICSLDEIRRAELAKHPKFRKQKVATVMGIKWNLRSSAFLLNQNMKKRRFALLFGKVVDGWVRVLACHEPPQRGLRDRLVLFEMQNVEKDAVFDVAKGLGLQIVGMALLHHGRGTANEDVAVDESLLRKFKVKQDQLTYRYQSSFVAHQLDRLAEHLRTRCADKLESIYRHYSNHVSDTHAVNVDELTNEEIVRVVSEAAKPAKPPMTAGEVLKAIDMENRYASARANNVWITVTVDSRSGAAEAYQVNRNLFPLRRENVLEAPRGEEGIYTLKSSRKLNVLGQFGETISDCIDLWSTCVPVAITNLMRRPLLSPSSSSSSKVHEGSLLSTSGPSDSTTSEGEKRDLYLSRQFLGANRLTSRGRPKIIDSAYIKQFLLSAISRDVPFTTTMSDFNFLVHLAQNYRQYGLQKWEVPALASHVGRREDEHIALFPPVLEAAVGMGYRCPICESEGRVSGNFSQRSLFSHIRNFHARRKQDRTKKLRCPLCAGDSSKPVHIRTMAYKAPLHKHLASAHGFEDKGDFATDTSRICQYFLNGHCRNGSSCPDRHSRPAPTPTTPGRVCQYFLNGHCRNGSSCPDRHSRPSPRTPAPICPYFLNGYCRNGSTCVDRHVRPDSGGSGSKVKADDDVAGGHSRVVWEFDSGGGVWGAYRASDADRIERNYRENQNGSGRNSMEYSFRGTRYLIDFRAMEQENTSTHKKRAIRRRQRGSSSHEARTPFARTVDPKVAQLQQLNPFKTASEIKRILDAANGDVNVAAQRLFS
eukprot:g4913.t1